MQTCTALTPPAGSETNPTNPTDADAAALLLNWLVNLPDGAEPAEAARRLLQTLPVPSDDQVAVQFYNWLEQISSYPQHRLNAQFRPRTLARSKN